MSLRLPLPDKQLLIMCDASQHAAGYVLLLEDYTDSDVGPMKSYAPVASGSQRFTEGQLSLTMYAKAFLAMHFAFDEIALILWGMKKPTIVMTDNKALTRFFQSKKIPPMLWKYCDQALQFDFVLAHVPGSISLSGQDLPKIARWDTCVQSWDRPAIEKAQTRWWRKRIHIRRDERSWWKDVTKPNNAVTPGDVPSMVSRRRRAVPWTHWRHQDPDATILTPPDPTLFFIRFYQRNQVHMVNQVCPLGVSEIVRAQGLNSEFQSMIRILAKQETPPRQMNFASTFFQKFYKNRKRLEVVNNVLYRQFFDNVGILAYRQIVVPPETTEAIIRTLLGDPMQGHPGASKMLGELRRRYCAPNIAEKVPEFVNNCQDCKN